MRILVTNDDGIFSEGITALAAALEDLGTVIVVAPDREQSASSHSLTLNRPLRMRKVRENWYTVDGTPTDCVNLAVHGLLADALPDLVVSGINFGLNLGDDVTYSGTVSATFEARLQDLPAVAFSHGVGEGLSFPRAARFARDLLVNLRDEGAITPELLLNVNFPAGAYQGVRFTRLGRRHYRQTVVEKQDPRGKAYYWIGGVPEWEDEAGTDHEALMRGYITVTPLRLDFTDHDQLAHTSTWQTRLDRLAFGDDD